MHGYTPRQYTVLSINGLVHLLISACTSLQAPYYTRLAETLSIPLNQYAVVFAAYQLTSFCTATLLAKRTTNILYRRVFLISASTVAVCYMSFLVLGHISHAGVFLMFSLFVRIIESIAATTFFVTSQSEVILHIKT